MAVLMDEEKEAGVAMVDIGGDTTDIAIFHKNIIRHTSVIPFGGNIVTRDIEEGCTIQAKYAELLKIRFGLALSEPASWNEVVSIPVLPGRPPKEISIKNLAYIIEARMEEIVEMIYAELSRAGYDRLTGGIVLTGGGSQLQYLRELFELTTGLHTRIGNPNQHMGRSQNEAVKAPMYAAAVGLVMAGFRAIDERENDYLKAKPVMAAAPPQQREQAPPRKEREQDGKPGGGRFFNSILDRTRRFCPTTWTTAWSTKPMTLTSTRPSHFMAESLFKFELPDRHRSIIKIIGVGGGGSNAVNHMFNQGIREVDFAVCNTDRQALDASPVPNKVRLGVTLTEDSGRGPTPNGAATPPLRVNRTSANCFRPTSRWCSSRRGWAVVRVRGPAPVIARLAQERGMLTVAIVTAPFSFEGRLKKENAFRGIEELRQYCDTVLLILNDKLQDIYGDLPKRKAFAEADNILT
jgi:hypothetical protein